MSNFEQLHPALQHHIVNSLGWREMRPFQDAVIPRALAGEHLIILAPTAGGKTEAAFFPTLSRILSEEWRGLSVLYLCPIKALVNNLDVRLQKYCSLVGRRASLWHGDVSATARKRILRDPPDCLLTTPESLEVMLVSPKVDEQNLFANLRVVIVDEVHAFAGDDRGWHLLSVLERITRLAGHEVQRIGLSATVGNPEALVDWLAKDCEGDRRVLAPPASTSAEADVKLDFVGSLVNAAVVISRLHRGEKRLVFIDSRARAEQLGAELRRLDVTTFVTHSSLSPDQRRQAEEAFASRDDCVIVATSVLELGVDVGDLDRVIQIDCPYTTSSFLQRMGRTGRRPGTTRNCLFLATRDATLIQAAGLIDLWREGFVEPVEPPPEPYHVLSQQLMALILQEGGVGRRTWLEWLRRVPGIAGLTMEGVEQVVAHMLASEILWEEAGILGVGRRGEEEFGRRHFMELLSVFTSPPLFAVLHGRQELGFVDELSFLGKQEGPRVLLLGGRPWRVNNVDWQRRIAHVEASEERGRSRWTGEGGGFGFRLCQSIQRTLAGDHVRDWWSQRARERMAALRLDFAWAAAEGTAIVTDQEGLVRWWTFAGGRANASLAPALAALLHSTVKHDSYCVQFGGSVTASDVERALNELRRSNADSIVPDVDPQSAAGLKFSECLPAALLVRILQRRLADPEGVSHVLSSSSRVVSG